CASSTRPARRSSWSRTRPTSPRGPGGWSGCATATSSRTSATTTQNLRTPLRFPPRSRTASPPRTHGSRAEAMRFLESLLYVGSILFVAAYLVMLAMLLFHDKGRRALVLALRSLWLH